MKIDQQIAVVTGGASGLGLACVQLLQERGAHVVIWDQQDASNVATTIPCDVSSAAEVENAIAITCERVGIPRICIHCAGIAPATKMLGKNGVMSLDAFHHVINVNLIGTFNVMRVIAAAMIQLPLLDGVEDRGILINTASVAAFEGQIGQAAYSASKGGVVSMTLPLARELAEHAIRINTIAPGLMHTPLFDNMPATVQTSLAAMVPFPKRLGHPDEFAALAIHLIENTLINGTVIRLDGALRMQPK